MKHKTPLSKIIDDFLVACAESEGLTEQEEIKQYIKHRKESINSMVKKGSNDYN
jgi:hypothetical protein